MLIPFVNTHIPIKRLKIPPRIFTLAFNNSITFMESTFPIFYVALNNT